MNLVDLYEMRQSLIGRQMLIRESTGLVLGEIASIEMAEHGLVEFGRVRTLVSRDGGDSWTTPSTNHPLVSQSQGVGVTEGQDGFYRFHAPYVGEVVIAPKHYPCLVGTLTE